MGGGDKLFAKIDKGIRECKVVISCVSEKYAKSPNGNREVNHFRYFLVRFNNEINRSNNFGLLNNYNFYEINVQINQTHLYCFQGKLGCKCWQTNYPSINGKNGLAPSWNNGTNIW